MCHDPSTAERYYVALPEKEVAFEIRQLRMKALERACEGSRATQTTESSDSEPPANHAVIPGTKPVASGPQQNLVIHSPSKIRVVLHRMSPPMGTQTTVCACRVQVPAPDTLRTWK